MARPKSKIKAVCQTDSCKYFRKEKGKDMVKRGFNRAGTQRYYCNHCETYLVETKGTPMYRRRLSDRKVKQICELLVEKNGVRATSRLAKVNKNTIGDWLDNLARHASQMTQYLIQDVGLRQHEVDELWTFIKKTKRKLSTQAKIGLSKANSGYTHA